MSNDRSVLNLNTHPGFRPVGNDSSNTLPPGGGPPYNGDMERRVAKLEDKMDNVQDSLSEIKVTLARMEGRFDCIDERISHLPTYRGIGFLVSSIIAAAAALTAVLHYFHIL